MSDQITIKAREVARNLTYNDDKPQAAAKHMLLELAHRLDARDIRVHRKRDGYLLINGLGRSRFMTLKERLCWLLFKLPPQAV
jgi:hypothetical protein